MRSPEEHVYPLTEQGTEKYASLEMAQAAALPILVQSLTKAILEGIARGRLTVLREGDKNVVRVESRETEESPVS